MSKKKNKIKELKRTDVNVAVIMQEIQVKAKKRSMDSDMERLKDIDFMGILLDDADVNQYQLDGGVRDEDLPENLSYINRHYSLIDKYNFVSTHRKGLIGKFANKVLNKLFLVIKVFIDKIVVSQEAFNFKVVRLFNRISKDLDAQSVEQAKQVDEVKIGVEEKLDAQEEKIKIVKNDILYPDLNIDYKIFEDRFRGDQKEILDKQSQYLRFFHECKNVMDGCGRGEFIRSLHDNGVGAFGVETDPMMVAECKKKGLNVVATDVVSYLDEQLCRENPDFVDGIFSAQVVEHLHMNYIIEMLELCYRMLQKDKFLVLETINIKSLSTFTNSVYLDPTHVKPVHPETLKFLVESCGFKFEGFILSGEFKKEDKLQIIEEKTVKDRVYNQNIERLNELLFAPQDYAIIAKK